MELLKLDAEWRIVCFLPHRTVSPCPLWTAVSGSEYLGVDDGEEDGGEGVDQVDGHHDDTDHGQVLVQVRAHRHHHGYDNAQTPHTGWRWELGLLAINVKGLHWLDQSSCKYRLDSVDTDQCCSCSAPWSCDDDSAVDDTRQCTGQFLKCII